MNIILNIEKEKEIKDIIKTFGTIEKTYKNLYQDFNIQLKEPSHILNYINIV